MITERLKVMRKKYKLTQADMAKRIGVSSSAYGMYEQGIRQCGHPILIKMANALNTTTDYLLGVADDPIKPALRVYNYTVKKDTPIEIAVVSAAQDFKLSNEQIIQLIEELRGKDRSKDSRK